MVDRVDVKGFFGQPREVEVYEPRHQHGDARGRVGDAEDVLAERLSDPVDIVAVHAYCLGGGGHGCVERYDDGGGTLLRALRRLLLAFRRHADK